MKKKLGYLIFLIGSLVCNAQQSGNLILGSYVRHPELGACDASYDFSYNCDACNTFSYSTDDYNSLTGRVVIRGEYYIKGDSITFYAITVFIPTLSELSRLTQNDLGMERITRDSITMMRSRPTSSNYWSLTGKDFRIAYQKVTLDPSKRYSASFFRQENDEYIEIDGERFYEDPGPED